MLSSPSHLLEQKHCKKSTFTAREGPARAVTVPDLHLFIMVFLSACGSQIMLPSSLQPWQTGWATGNAVLGVMESTDEGEYKESPKA